MGKDKFQASQEGLSWAGQPMVESQIITGGLGRWKRHSAASWAAREFSLRQQPEPSMWVLARIWKARKERFERAILLGETLRWPNLVE